MISAIGAVGGAVSGSRLAYCTLYPKKCKGTKSTNGAFKYNGYGDSVVFELPEEYKYIENFGVYHNLLLDEVYSDYTDENAEIKWFENKIENINDVDYLKLYNSNIYTDAIYNIEMNSIGYIEKNMSAEFLLESYEDLGYISGTFKEVFISYKNTLDNSKSFDDVKKITEYYISEISNSDLPKNDKEALFAALTVNIQSVYYWSNFNQN